MLVEACAVLVLGPRPRRILSCRNCQKWGIPVRPPTLGECHIIGPALDRFGLYRKATAFHHAGGAA